MEVTSNYFKQISDMIAEARNRAEVAVNSELVLRDPHVLDFLDL